MPLRPIPCAPSSASMRSPSSCTGSRGSDCRPLPVGVERRDYEYIRQGTANLFVVTEPLRGWRHVCVRARPPHPAGLGGHDQGAGGRSTILQAEKIVLVMDNLNTHTPASL